MEYNSKLIDKFNVIKFIENTHTLRFEYYNNIHSARLEGGAGEQCTQTNFQKF
jgi:predicted adenine nucleotide alpha hydrolase (AANH) superfamily ATPase